MKPIFFIFVLFLTISCVEKKKYSNAKYLYPTDSLQVEVGSPSLIKIAGNQLFTDKSFADSYNIDVIDIEHDSIMYSFAKKGQGPNEFLQITSMDIFRKTQNWYIALFDNLLRKLVVYSIDSLNYHKGQCPPVCVKELPVNSRFMEIYEIQNGYIATGRTEKKYTLLNKDMKCLSTFGNYLTCDNKDTDYMSLSKANYGRLYLSSDKTSVASVVFMSGTLSVLTLHNQQLTPAWSYEASGFEYAVNGRNLKQLSPTGYLAAGFTKENVVGLYSGEEKNGKTNYGNEFHIFSTQGELLNKYKISSQLYNFCISENDGLIYAISYENDPKIIIYKL